MNTQLTVTIFREYSGFFLEYSGFFLDMSQVLGTFFRVYSSLIVGVGTCQSVSEIIPHGISRTCGHLWRAVLSRAVTKTFWGQLLFHILFMYICTLSVGLLGHTDDRWMGYKTSMVLGNHPGIVGSRC